MENSLSVPRLRFLMLRRSAGRAADSNPQRKQGNGLRPLASLAYAAGYDGRLPTKNTARNIKTCASGYYGPPRQPSGATSKPLGTGKTRATMILEKYHPRSFSGS